MINLKVEEHCTMKNHNNFMVNLILEILIKLESNIYYYLDFGLNMLECFMKIIKKDKEHYIYQMEKDLKESFYRILLVDLVNIIKRMDK